MAYPKKNFLHATTYGAERKRKKKNVRCCRAYRECVRGLFKPPFQPTRNSYFSLQVLTLPYVPLSAIADTQIGPEFHDKNSNILE